MNIPLQYGDKELHLEVPKRNLLGILAPKDLPKVKDEVEAIKTAIENPIGTVRIPELIRFKDAKNAVIIVSDLTRVVPDNLIIPILLNELNKAGVPDKRITIIVATGTHPPPDQEALKKRLGREVFKRVKIEIHDPKNEANHVFIGKTSLGNEVYVNEAVAEANLKISTGSIMPHIIAGYSGGRKAILPGVSAEKTISYNHGLKFILDPNVRPGVINNNPIHRDMEEATRLVGIDFIVNTILNSKDEISYVFAGDAFEAWKEGVEVAKKTFDVKLSERVPVLITDPGGYPHDMNLFQSLSKGVNPFWPLVKDGGIVILVARCNEGVGNKLMEHWLVEAKSPEDLIKRAEVDGLKVGPHVAWYTCYRVLRRAKLILVSDIPADLVEEMLMTPAEDVQTALDIALNEVGMDSKIAVIPYAAKVAVRIDSQIS